MRSIRWPSLPSSCLTFPSCSIPKGHGSHPGAFPPLPTAPSSTPPLLQVQPPFPLLNMCLHSQESEAVCLGSCCCLNQEGSFSSLCHRLTLLPQVDRMPTHLCEVFVLPRGRLSSFENHTLINQLTSHGAGVLPALPHPTLQKKLPDEVAPVCANSLFTHLGQDFAACLGDPSPCMCKSPNHQSTRQRQENSYIILG